MAKKLLLCVIAALSLLLFGCSLSKNFVVFPEPPYPVSYHQKNQTVQWFLYWEHYK